MASLKTIFTVVVDSDEGVCIIEAPYEEPITYSCSIDSYESIAYSVGEAVSDYLQGFG